MIPEQILVFRIIRPSDGPDSLQTHQGFEDPLGPDGQDHGPPWSRRIVRAGMVGNSEHCYKVRPLDIRSYLLCPVSLT